MILKKIFCNYGYKNEGLYAFDFIRDHYSSDPETRVNECLQDREDAYKEARSIFDSLGMINDDNEECFGFGDEYIEISQDDGKIFHDTLIKSGWIKEYIAFGP